MSPTQITPTFSLKRRHSRKVMINVTSLIDVLFLLLIFFMVSSTFAEQPRIKLELPEARTAEVTRLEPWILSISREKQAFLNDEPISLPALSERFKEVAAQDPDKVLVLKADREVSYGFVIEVLDLAKGSGLKRISALTQPASHTPRD